MLGTIFVVVGALAIAVIGCEVLDPMTAMSNPSKQERRSRSATARREPRARPEESVLRSLSWQNPADDASPKDGEPGIAADSQVSAVELYPAARTGFSRWWAAGSNGNLRSQSVSAIVPFTSDRTYSNGGEPGDDRF